jgi:hypothetical protein
MWDCSEKSILAKQINYSMFIEDLVTWSTILRRNCQSHVTADQTNPSYIYIERFNNPNYCCTYHIWSNPKYCCTYHTSSNPNYCCTYHACNNPNSCCTYYTCIISTTVIGIVTCIISTTHNWDCFMYNKYNSNWDCYNWGCRGWQYYYLPRTVNFWGCRRKRRNCQSHVTADQTNPSYIYIERFNNPNYCCTYHIWSNPSSEELGKCTYRHTIW